MQNTFSLTIKGSKNMALIACITHNANVLSTKELNNHTLCVVTADIHDVCEWFAEDNGRNAPYPLGSLLLWRQIP